MSKTTDRMDTLLHELHLLLKEGQFTRQELRFIEQFLEAMLGATRKVIERAGAGDENLADVKQTFEGD